MAQQNHADVLEQIVLVGRGVNNKTRAAVEVGKYYYLGGSGSPDIVLVTRTAEDRFWYRGYPYDETVREMMIEQWIGLDLIARAESTMRRRIEQLERLREDETRNTHIAHIRKVLDECRLE